VQHLSHTADCVDPKCTWWRKKGFPTELFMMEEDRVVHFLCNASYISIAVFSWYLKKKPTPHRYLNRV